MYFKKVCLGILAAMIFVSGFSCPKEVFARGAFDDCYPLPELTGDQADDFIAVAESQIGYTESETGQAIYSEWAGQSGRPWCSEFVAWCAYKAGIPDAVIPVGLSSNNYRAFYAEKKRFYLPHNGQINGRCGCGKLASKTIFVNGIKKGDILLIETNGNFNDGPDHTGICEYVSENVIHTIEGNCMDTVARTTRDIGSIHGVCRPKFGKYPSVFRSEETSIVGRVRAKKKGFQVRWKKIAKVAGYQIQYSENSNFENSRIQTVEVSVKKYTVRNLASRKKYYVRVRAYRGEGRKVYYSDWSKASSVVTK